MDFVTINHPEPPQQDGREGDGVAAEGGAGGMRQDHLLTPAFFAAAHRVLAPGGRLCVVTDCLWYGKLILKTLGELSGEEGVAQLNVGHA